MKEKKVPMRKCVGCMISRPKGELFRISGKKDGTVSLDLTGKAQGRGVYLCSDTACFEKAKKKKSISRNLGINVPDEKLEEIFSEIKRRSEMIM